MSALKRCEWVPVEDPLYMAYHDEEWGVPVRDDRMLFEFLVLEGAQAGLSWRTILGRRDHYRKVFDGFDVATVAGYDDAKITALLGDPGIIRNRLKVASAVKNAQGVLAIQAEFGSLSDFLWGFVGGQRRVNHWRSLAELPSETAESRAMNKALKQRGFTFVGPTICYAFMQACGMVNDHTVDCFRHGEV